MNCLSAESGDPAPDMPRAVFGRLAERDLRRISTVRLLTPPPSDPHDPSWEGAWENFQRMYVPALRRFVFNFLLQSGVRTNAMLDAEEIVSDFVCQRLKDGRLAGPEAGVRRFRDWLAKQMECFTIDQLRARSTQKRQPAHGFAPASALDTVTADYVDASLLASITEQIVASVVDAVLVEIRKRKPDQAYVLWDLLQNGCRQSPDTAEVLGVTRERLRGIRREARASFQAELVRMVHRGPFAGGDIEDLILVLRRIGGFRK